MHTATQKPPKNAAGADNAREPVFGVNEMRLNPREWLTVIAIVLTCAILLPRTWKRFETFKPEPDYRIPYSLSKDYWLWQRRLELAAKPEQVIVVGDSVVWGEYVRPDGTLTHFLNRETGQPDRFINCGVNGLFPLAMEGLLHDYGDSLHNRKVIVHCNMLWITSPKADLSLDREQTFNHARLVPQFSIRIPSYRAAANERLSAVIEPQVELFKWVNHIQSAYYDQKSLPNWTLVDDGRDPPAYPNAWRNPLSPFAAGIPTEPPVDPARGPSSQRHKPWNSSGSNSTDFEWVDLDTSLQWKSFLRLLDRLRDHGNDVLVILGPFNKHLIAADQQPTYAHLQDRIATQLQNRHFETIVPPPLPSNLYADASHPLTEGYAALAAEIDRNPVFRSWLNY